MYIPELSSVHLLKGLFCPVIRGFEGQNRKHMRKKDNSGEVLTRPNKHCVTQVWRNWDTVRAENKFKAFPYYVKGELQKYQVFIWFTLLFFVHPNILNFQDG